MFVLVHQLFCHISHINIGCLHQAYHLKQKHQDLRI